MDIEHNKRVKAFREDLRNSDLRIVVQKHLTYGPCYLFSEDEYFELKHQVAEKFGLHPNEVLVVGSAKLGFSIVSGKRYRKFCETSDVDIALVAPHLFEKIWSEAYSYYTSGAYWPNYSSFCDYLFQGWIRPDKLPPDSSFSRGAEWWEYFRQLSSSGHFGQFGIRAGLYRSWNFLETYQRQCVNQCKQNERLI